MYLKKTYTYGNRIEIRKYHAYKYGSKGEKRARREKATPEQVQANNERQRTRKLQRLLIGNFTEDDYHIVLTYAQENRPDPEMAKKNIQKFFRKMRAEYKNMGDVLKYIAVTEYHSAKIHHHIVISGCRNFGRVLRKCWKEGGVHPEPLYANRDFDGLANYLTKETRKTFREEQSPWRQAYTCSRNLEKPEVKREIVKADSWREDPECPPSLERLGYYLDKESVVSGFDSMGYPYQEYMLVRAVSGRRGK